MFLKNKNIIFKIRRSKVTDYAAISNCFAFAHLLHMKVQINDAIIFFFNLMKLDS